jgi:hypothetical protein
VWLLAARVVKGSLFGHIEFVKLAAPERDSGRVWRRFDALLP